MHASKAVGRVGALALALGAGVIVYGSCAVASADDTASRGADSTRVAAATRTSKSPEVRGSRGSAGATKAMSTAEPRRLASASATGPRAASARTVLTELPPQSPAAAHISAASSVDSIVPMHREVAAAAATARNIASATTTAVSTNGVTVTPTVELTAEGIVQGRLQATSARGASLIYTVLGTACKDSGSSNGGGTQCGLGSNGGKLTLDTVPVASDPTVTDPQSYTILPYATWLDGASSGNETFQVRVSEVTDFDAFVTSIPVIGAVAVPVINVLQQLPLISTVLAPLIGGSVVASIGVDVGSIASAGKRVAFTYQVTSFDGIKISTNFFPSVAVATGANQLAPTVLEGPGIGDAGYLGPYALYGQGQETLGVGSLRSAGYNVITWDPRGEWNSGGILQFDSVYYEARDVSAILDWATLTTPAVIDDTGIAVGMVGGSYGGGIQMVAASRDPRIDAIIPDIAFHQVIEGGVPNGIYKTLYGFALALWLNSTGARINSEINSQAITGILTGLITETARAFLSAGPTGLLNQLRAPILLTQGTVDLLVTPQQAMANAQEVEANPYNVPVKMIWFCGGHGVCSTGTPKDQPATLLANGLAWLDQYVKRQGTNPADDIPKFQWWDQNGTLHASNLMPYNPNFATMTAVSSGTSGSLGIVPFIGGSGPAPGGLYGALSGAPATNAINVDLSSSVLTPGKQVVGIPQLTFDYQGLGTARAVFAQIVVTDASGNQTVLGNQVAPVPVTLDGRPHSISIPFDIAPIAYTVNPGDKVTLQLTSSALVYEAIYGFGGISIRDIAVTVPIVNQSSVYNN